MAWRRSARWQAQWDGECTRRHVRYTQMLTAADIMEPLPDDAISSRCIHATRCERTESPATAHARDTNATAAIRTGRSVEDLELGARLVFGKQGTEYDPAPLPYRDPDMPNRLRFGFYISGACWPPSCSLTRAPHPSSRLPSFVRSAFVFQASSRRALEPTPNARGAWPRESYHHFTYVGSSWRAQRTPGARCVCVAGSVGASVRSDMKAGRAWC